MLGVSNYYDNDAVFQYDWILFIVGCLVMVGLYVLRRRAAAEEVRRSVVKHDTDIPNVKIASWHTEEFVPTAREISMVERVFDAAIAAWPELIERLREIQYVVWIVRNPDQKVGWRMYGGIAWRDVPSVNRIEARDPALGYGGMAEHSNDYEVMYVSTFFPDRPPERLLAHELTHCSKPIYGHDDPFADYERRLVSVMDQQVL